MICQSKIILVTLFKKASEELLSVQAMCSGISLQVIAHLIQQLCLIIIHAHYIDEQIGTLM